MTRRNYSEIKAQKRRERVRRHRMKKKIKNNHDNAVSTEIKRREKNQKLQNNDSFNEPNENTPKEENVEDMFDMKANLQTWAVKHNTTRRAINDLLMILTTAGFVLPKDSRTLMRTPVDVDIRDLVKGQIWYHGLKQSLENIFQNFEFRKDISITLDFNFDGVPLYNS